MPIRDLIKVLKGGKGSGNFGHAGRPGVVGGSGGAGGSKSMSGKSEWEKSSAKPVLEKYRKPTVGFTKKLAKDIDDLADKSYGAAEKDGIDPNNYEATDKYQRELRSDFLRSAGLKYETSAKAGADTIEFWEHPESNTTVEVRLDGPYARSIKTRPTKQRRKK